MRIIVVFVLIIGFFACEESSSAMQNPTFKSIKYGTSFGECLGYCNTEVELSSSAISVKIRSTAGDERSNTASISEDTYNEIVGGIDWENFTRLEDVIGCPDCADGGAEWLQLETSDTSKKVTFEYQSDIKGISSALSILRSLAEEHRPSED